MRSPSPPRGLPPRPSTSFHSPSPPRRRPPPRDDRDRDGDGDRSWASYSRVQKRLVESHDERDRDRGGGDRGLRQAERSEHSRSPRGGDRGYSRDGDRRPFRYRDGRDSVSRSRSPRKRSLSAEEGQIRSPPRRRLRSPSPLPRRHGRDRSWGRRSRSRSPPGRRAPSTGSSMTLSSRYNSPEKRRSPVRHDRARSPPPRRRVSPPRRSPSRSRSPRPRPNQVPSVPARPPPSAPRSERLPTNVPTGPRTSVRDPVYPPESSSAAPNRPEARMLAPPSRASSTSASPLPQRAPEPARPYLDTRSGSNTPAPRRSITPLPPAEPKMSEAEVAAIRAKEEEARIMAELPPLKVPFGRAQWEIDLDMHSKRMADLQTPLIKAQSAYRLAAISLREAEADRAAARLRSQVADEQLKALLARESGPALV